MKRVKLLFVTMAAMLLLTGCELNRKKILSVEELPEAAQTYIREKMGDAKVLYVKKERKNFKTWYEVKFDNRMEIEFDSKGEIRDIDVDD